MKYKEYSAHIAYSEEDGCFIGHIAGITDIVGFHADTDSELQAAFERSRGRLSGNVSETE